jgi:RNA polymerase sigma factor for flagellar operon FliA
MRATSAFVQRKSRISRGMRDRIVLEHLPLAKSIASRVHETLPVHVDLDDLIHAGVFGLFDAVAKYDPQKNVAFHAYAKHRIDWASRDLRKRQKQADSATQALASKLGRAPQENEIAEEMGLTPDRWHKIKVELRTVGAISSSASPDPDFDKVMNFPATAELQPDRMCGQRQLQATLARAMEKLPGRYQKVVFLYYTDEMTMKEIGEAMGVNESRVSQIHKIALKKMATTLHSEGIDSAKAF